MAKSIQAIFISPGIAFARLGGSSIPQSAFEWTDSTVPRADGKTSIRPLWSLVVQPDGSVQPFLPDTVEFRDGELIRPVAPFFEIWARFGDDGSAPDSWTETPLTPALLQDAGLALTALQMTLTARNLKAARRTQNRQLAFGTFPPLTLSADDVTRHAVPGVSPSSAARAMIPRGRQIPLGGVQFLRATPQPAGQAWSDIVNVETLRFRFTPATGLFYGPPEAGHAAPQNGQPMPAVRPENAFLDAAAGWFNVAAGDLVEPADTYDFVDDRIDGGPSLGVVDDTCEVHFELSLRRPRLPDLEAKAVAFVGPPDFAPDRRPFLSAADELNDREADAKARNDAMDNAALDRWVTDLFERIYETASLFNLDHFRARRAENLATSQLNSADLDNGARTKPKSAMGGRDKLRNVLYRLAGPSENIPLPLSEHARMRHRAMADLENLIELVSLDPDRIKSIVRPPFEVGRGEDASRSSMRMPPFMRQSNAMPLTLANWQYELLMRWVDGAAARTSKQVLAEDVFVDPAARRLSPAAEERRRRVLMRLDATAAVSRS